MHRLACIWHAIFLLIILFTTPILAGRQPRKVIAYRTGRAAEVAQIKAMRAAAADIRQRPPVIDGSCTLEAQDRASHRTKCIPAHCFNAGGRCVLIRSPITKQLNCMKHVVKRDASIRTQFGEEIVQHGWSKSVKGLPFLANHCQGCVCKNVHNIEKEVAATNMRWTASKNEDGDVAKEENEERSREESKNSDFNVPIPDESEDSFNLEEIMNEYPV